MGRDRCVDYGTEGWGFLFEDDGDIEDVSRVARVVGFWVPGVFVRSVAWCFLERWSWTSTLVRLKS